VAGGGACCRLGWLVGRGGGTAAADRPPLLAQIAGGWGAGVVLQVVADLYLPYFTPPDDPGGEGLGEESANQVNRKLWTTTSRQEG
jgi:hypothetical protein